MSFHKTASIRIMLKEERSDEEIERWLPEGTEILVGSEAYTVGWAYGSSHAGKPCIKINLGAPRPPKTFHIDPPDDFQVVAEEP